MASSNLPEVWLRGPVAGCPPLLQPVAHALLQAREEINGLLTGFSDEALWVRPAGVASVGFHLQHMAGVADRLFTYARGEALSEAQLSALAAEQNPPFPGCVTADLLERFNGQIEKALDELQQIAPGTLTSYRAVGREQLPSTVIGLLVHCAEHTMRHAGQMLVTVRVLGSLPA
jgi:uncharacterized damage-inducible protein DinB